MIKVRRARQSDAEELARLSSQLGYLISGNELARILAILDSDDDHAIFVAEKNPKNIAGFVHIFLTRRLFLASFAELGGLVVDSDSWGEGFGVTLLKAAERWVVKQGVKEIRVRSNILREEARGFYLEQGFQDSKKQTVFYKSISR